MQTKSNPGVPTTPITTGILNDYVERMTTHNKEILEVSERIKSKMNTITPFFPPSNNDVAPIPPIDETVSSRFEQELYIMQQNYYKLFDILNHLQRIV
jgi:hypothetical protein